MKTLIFICAAALFLASCKKDEPQPQAGNSTNPPVDTTGVTDTSGCIKPGALMKGEWVVYARVINKTSKTFFDPAIPVNVSSTSFGFNGNTAPASYSADGSVISTDTGSGSGQYKVSVYDCSELILSDGSLVSGMLYEFYLKKKQ
jgi:hypothetical protein